MKNSFPDLLILLVSDGFALSLLLGRGKEFGKGGLLVYKVTDRIKQREHYLGKSKIWLLCWHMIKRKPRGISGEFYCGEVRQYTQPHQHM